MNAGQIEQTVILLVLVYVTLAAYGFVPFGDGGRQSQKFRKLFRVVGPLGVLGSGIVLALSFAGY